MYDTDYRESLSQSIRQIVDNNDAAFLERLRARVTDRIRTGSGFPDATPDEYAGVLAHDGAREVARNVCDVVRDTIYDEAVKGLPAGLGLTLLGDLLDYGNVALWEDIASAYVPSVQDYARAINHPDADLY